MKKIYTLLVAALILYSYGCSKSSVNIQQNKTTSLAGQTYYLYRVVDTTYYNPANQNRINSIIHYSFYGDTVYLNPGDPQYYRVEPNAVVGFNPTVNLADTLVFKTAASGVDNSYFYPTDFTYSMSTHVFAEPPVPAGTSSKIIQLDAKTIEILTYSNDPQEDHTGSYYQK